MPLNLLHHKSWHVGSARNQERVRRDEEQARLKEEEEERQMQEEDAQHRMSILMNQMERQRRGEHPLSPEEEAKAAERSALLDNRFASPPPQVQGITPRVRRKPAPSAAPAGAGGSIFGADGHINLFPKLEQPPESSTPIGVPRHKQPKALQNAEYVAAKKREEDSLEAQYTMKISEPSRPWYASVDGVSQADEEKEEKKRQWEERIEARVRDSNDPLNAMRSNLKKLKDQKEDAAREKKRRDADMGIGVDQRVLNSQKRDEKGDRSRRSGGGSSRRNYDDERDYRSRDHRDSHHKSSSRHGRDHSGRNDDYHRSEKRDRSRSPHRHRHRNDNHGSSRRREHSRSRSRSPMRKHRRSRSRSRSRSRDRDHRRSHSSRHKDDKKQRSSGTDAVMDRLREEQRKREADEKRKMHALVEDELKVRKPERWTVTENTAGRGRYSRQFGA